MRARKALAIVTVAAFLAGACSDDGEDAAPPTTEAPAVDAEEISTRLDVEPVPFDELMPAAIEDIQQFWAGEAGLSDAYGIDYERIDESDQHPYSEDDLPPPCAGHSFTWDEIAFNAFWCRDPGFVAWDEQELMPMLYSDYGPFAVAMVMAHEWGHAVQTQVGFESRTIDMEQQADCFAGAWSADVLEREPAELGFVPDDLEVALGGLLAFRDEPGTDIDGVSAHGSGFDRINAFQEGFERGAKRCAEFETDPPEVTELYWTEAEYDTGGNVDYDDAVEMSALDLNDYWGDVFPAFEAITTYVPYDLSTGGTPICDGERLDEDEAAYLVRYCAEEHKVVWDEAMMKGVHADIGDFAVATLLGTVWAEAAQRQLDDDPEFTSSRPAELQRACFTGAWAGRLMEEGNSRYIGKLSPGDLDESVQAFLSFAEASDEATVEGMGSAFRRAQAFRIGFYGSPSDCDALAR